MKKVLVSLALLSFMSACTLLDMPTKQIQVACATVTASVKTLAEYKHKLTEKQIGTVNDLLLDVYPICGTGDRPEIDAVTVLVIEKAQDKFDAIVMELRK
jgi:hypothetical protein